MKKLLFLFTLSCLAVQGHAQVQLHWQKCLGGSNSDYTEDIHQTADGGYIVAGSTWSKDGDVSGNHGYDDYWVVKLSVTGVIEWQKCYGGKNSDEARSVEQTSDGGYIVAGSTLSSDGDITGLHGTNWDIWVVKLSSTGELIWQKCLGGSNSDEAYSIKQTSDGGYVVAGNTLSTDGDVTVAHSAGDTWIVKLSNTGSIEWQKAMAGSSKSIEQAYDGGYILAGTTGGAHGPNKDMWVIKLSDTGRVEWERSLGGSDDDEGYSVVQTYDSGYAITGYCNSKDGDVTGHIGYSMSLKDEWIVKLAKDGSMEWNECLDGFGYESGNSIQQTPDSGYVICGNDYRFSGTAVSSATLSLIKISKTGSVQWGKGLGNVGEGGNAVSQTSDGGYIAAGYVSSKNVNDSWHEASLDGWILKFGAPTAVTNVAAEAKDVSIVPNPATNELTITSGETITSLAIVSMTGQMVYTNTYNTKELKVDVNKLAAGTYVIRVNNMVAKQFLKQ